MHPATHLKKGLRLEMVIYIFLFFFKDFFWCGPFLKSLLNLLQYCFCFKFWFFGYEACGILAPPSGIEPAPPAQEGEVLTTGLPGKSPSIFFSLPNSIKKTKKQGNICMNKLNIDEQAWKVTIDISPVRPYFHRLQHVFYYTEAL